MVKANQTNPKACPFPLTFLILGACVTLSFYGDRTRVYTPRSRDVHRLESRLVGVQHDAEK